MVNEQVFSGLIGFFFARPDSRLPCGVRLNALQIVAIVAIKQKTKKCFCLTTATASSAKPMLRLKLIVA